MKITHKTIKNRQVFASAIPIADDDVTKFAGAFKLDEPPGMMIFGQFVKQNDGKTQLFGSEAEAIKAAQDLAEKLLA